MGTTDGVLPKFLENDNFLFSLNTALKIKKSLSNTVKNSFSGVGPRFHFTLNNSAPKVFDRACSTSQSTGLTWFSVCHYRYFSMPYRHFG